MESAAECARRKQERKAARRAAEAASGQAAGDEAPAREDDEAQEEIEEEGPALGGEKETAARKAAKKEAKRKRKAEAAAAAAATAAPAAPGGVESDAESDASGAARKKARVSAHNPSLSAAQNAAAGAFREENNIKVDGDNVPAPLASLDAARKAFSGDARQPFDVCCKTFSKPSPIQAQAWPIVLSGVDLVGVAETGSGKTLAFLLPGIKRMLDGLLGKAGAGRPRALVLAPTRELAMQSAKVAEQACEACADLSAVVVFGGNPKWEQRKQIEQCATLDIVVATPGRLLDFVNDKVLDLGGVRYLVLDEADRMLDMGFEKDVRKIIEMCAPKRQTVMFSATWPREIRELAATFMKSPVKVTVGSERLAASLSVKQHVEVLDQADKERRMLQLLKQLHNGKNRVIVFALYKKEAERIEQTLQRQGYKVMGVHGDKSQSAREEAVRQFDLGASPVLVATDVASRGLDIKGVEYVINVSFPLTVEDYVHRIGRTGRAGATGEAYTFFTAQDKHLAGALQNVLRQAGCEVPPDLAKFGNTVKKKEHKLYGAHFNDDVPTKPAAHVTFSDDDE